MAIKHSPGCGCCGSCFSRAWSIRDHADGLIADPPAITEPPIGLAFDGEFYTVNTPVPCDEFVINLTGALIGATLELFYILNGTETIVFSVAFDQPEEEEVNIPEAVVNAGSFFDNIQAGGLNRPLVWPPSRTSDEEAGFPHRRRYFRSRGTAGDILHSYDSAIFASGNWIAQDGGLIGRYPLTGQRLEGRFFRVRRRSIEFAGGCPINMSPPTLLSPNVVIERTEQDTLLQVRFKPGEETQGIEIAEIYDAEKNLRLDCLNSPGTQTHSPSFAGLKLQIESASFGSYAMNPVEAQLIHTDQNGVTIENHVAKVSAAMPLKPEFIADSNTVDVPFICAAKFEYPYTELWRGFDYIKDWIIFQSPFGAPASGGRLYWWDTVSWNYEGQTSVAVHDEQLTVEEISELAPDLIGGEYWYRVNSRYYAIDENGTQTTKQFADFVPVLPRLRFLAQASVGFSTSVGYRKLIDGFTSDADITFTVDGNDFISTELDGSPTTDYVLPGNVVDVSRIYASQITMTWRLNDGQAP